MIARMKLALCGLLIISGALLLVVLSGQPTLPAEEEQFAAAFETADPAITSSLPEPAADEDMLSSEPAFEREPASPEAADQLELVPSDEALPAAPPTPQPENVALKPTPKPTARRLAPTATPKPAARRATPTPAAANPLPKSRSGWPATTAETTLAKPVAKPPTTGKWIDVNLTRQTATAYIGSKPIKTVLVSTGLAKYPTVTGKYRIYAKIPSQTMSGGSRAAGDYYRLPNVPNVMYFYQGYGLHGTYWHRNFGRPMSHGCVNLTLADAKWFFSWAPMGTLVYSHK